MALISIEEQQGGEVTRWRATLSFNHGPKHPITVCNAFSPEQEQELEWYFEEHLCFPFTNKVKAQRAAASIQSYGEALFDQVFADRKAYATYQGCVQAGLPTVQIEISGSPAFHSLHWEALKDPDLSQPLALQATMVRKNLTPSPVEATGAPFPNHQPARRHSPSLGQTGCRLSNHLSSNS